MNNTFTDNQKSIFLVIFVSLCAFFIYAFLLPFRKYTFERPQAYANVEFGEIAYYERSLDRYGLMFMDSDGTNLPKPNIFVPTQEGITIFGEKLYRIDKGIRNSFDLPVWSPDGKNLGVIFHDASYSSFYPALIRENGEILICLQHRDLITKYGSTIQVIDDERIIINIYDKDDPKLGNYDSAAYLSLYNMEDCREESIFYDGLGEEDFAVSSKMWLAINEYTDELCLNVYDEQKNLLYTDDSSEYFYNLEWSKDGNKLAYQTNGDENNDARFHIHDFLTGTTIDLEKRVDNSSFSPNGEKIIVQLSDNQIVIIDLISWEETVVAKGENPAWRP